MLDGFLPVKHPSLASSFAMQAIVVVARSVISVVIAFSGVAASNELATQGLVTVAFAV